ncbi:hypothetical protein Gotur_029837 [Gossypium turneri]
MESGVHVATPILNVVTTNNIQNVEIALDVATPSRDKIVQGTSTKKDYQMASFSISASGPSIEFQESNTDKYLQQLQLSTFIQEQGFDLLIRSCKRIWENAIEREWTKFCLPERLWPTTDMSEIGPIHAIITYGILQKKQICIGAWIYRNMVEYARNLGKGIFFPHLITELCKRAGVPI